MIAITVMAVGICYWLWLRRWTRCSDRKLVPNPKTSMGKISCQSAATTLLAPAGIHLKQASYREIRAGPSFHIRHIDGHRVQGLDRDENQALKHDGS